MKANDEERFNVAIIAHVLFLAFIVAFCPRHDSKPTCGAHLSIWQNNAPSAPFCGTEKNIQTIAYSWSLLRQGGGELGITYG